jgi:hypothetical protein
MDGSGPAEPDLLDLGLQEPMLDLSVFLWIFLYESGPDCVSMDLFVYGSLLMYLGFRMMNCEELFSTWLYEFGALLY